MRIFMIFLFAFALPTALPTWAESSDDGEQIFFEDGQQIYFRFCSNCHKPIVDTELSWYPNLKEIVETSSPEDLTLRIDGGQFRRAGDLHTDMGINHTIPVMPAWSWLSDRELASLVNYLIKTLSNKETRISEPEVRALRQPAGSSELSDHEKSAANHLYVEHCVGCHGAKRQGVIGPPLSHWPIASQDFEIVRGTMHYGTWEGMPSWGVDERLSAHQMTLLTRYLRESRLQDPPEFDLDVMRQSWQAPKVSLASMENQKQLLITLLHDARKVLFTDPDKKKALVEVDIGDAPYAVLQDNAIFLLTRGGWVVQIDPNTKRIRARVRAGYEPAAMAFRQAEDDQPPVLAVTTVAPPGISFFNSSTLEPIKRVDIDEPLGPVLNPDDMRAVFARVSGCIYRVTSTLELSDSCSKGNPYPRYAIQIPNTSLGLVVGESGSIQAFDTQTLKAVADIEVGERFTPGNGSLVQHPKYGLVFVVGSMTSDQIFVIGVDPVNKPSYAWQLVEKISAPEQGSLFVATHEKSANVFIDAPLSAEQPGSILMLDRGDFEQTPLVIATPEDLSGTPRAIEPLFDPTGKEVWLTVWNRLDATSALVVINAKNGKIKATIKDNRLTTPTRSFWIKAAE